MELRMKRLVHWLMILIIAIIIAIGVNRFGVALSVVSGTSMQPTLQDGDRLLINKWRFLLHAPRRGEVITFRDPNDPDRYLVKRVVGVPGDSIEIRDGILYRNGTVVDEPYIDTKIEDGDFGPISVRQGTVFVMGDNRHRFASRDSRYESLGLVPVHLVDGKVELILWRPSLAAFL